MTRNRIITLICLFCKALLIFVVHESYGQYPGGVRNPVFWETDFGQDDSDDFGYALFNFHPYRFFNEQGDSFSLPSVALMKMSFFIVFSSLNETEISRISTGHTEVFLTDSAMISGGTFTYPPTFLRPKFISFIETFPFQRKLPDLMPLFRIGSDPEGYIWYEGGIAEAILYDRYLDEMQRNRVESYLSLKFGISLPDSSDYYRSDGIPVWTSEDHPVYRYRLTGIGRDDGSLLYQKQSHNLYGDVGLTIAFNGIATSNSDNSSTIADHSYILWADNDNGLNFEPMDTSGWPSRMERVWEVTVSDSTLRSIPLHLRLDSTAVNVVMDSTLSLWLVRLENPEWNFDHAEAEYILMDQDSTGDYSCLFFPDVDASGSDLFSFVIGPSGSMSIKSDTIHCGELYGDILVYWSGLPEGSKEIILRQSDNSKWMSRSTKAEFIKFDRLDAGSYEVKVISPSYASHSMVFRLEKEVCEKPGGSVGTDIIYPNPASTDNDFTLSLREWENGLLSITIMNAEGRVIRHEKIDRIVSDAYISRVNQVGTYVIVINGGGKIRRYKLVIQK